MSASGASTTVWATTRPDAAQAGRLGQEHRQQAAGRRSPTHDMWAVSARCTVWGSRPTASRRGPAAASRAGCPAAWPTRRSRRAAAATPNTAQKNREICIGCSGAGSGHGNLRKANARLRKLVYSSCGGGNGSRRPARRSNTGSRTMPRMALPGPASARCTRYGLSPTAAPSASRLRPAPSSANRNSTPSDRPRHSDQVGPEQQGRPGEQPGDRAARGRGSRPGSSARVATADRPHREPDAADPGEGGHADGRDDDDGGDRARTGRRCSGPSGSRCTVTPEMSRTQLEQADQALGPHRHAEDLEEPGDRPDAARAVEVEEVAVGDVARAAGARGTRS